MRAPVPKAAVLLAGLLPAGCDLFGTREFTPRPAEIRAFAGALTREDTIVFRVTESLASPGEDGPDSVLAKRQVRFARAPESLQTSEGWVALSFRVYADPPAGVLDEGLCHVRFAAEGLSLRATDSSSAGAGGTRYFPLKISAAAASADSQEFLALPPAFAMGGAWTQALGVLTVGREVSDTDTLDYRGRLEESWRIEETVSDGNRLLSRGTFWYGATGLLKGRQSWNLEERGADGGLSALRELRRDLERL